MAMAPPSKLMTRTFASFSSRILAATPCLRRIMFQRFENVGVSLRVAAKNPAQQRHENFKVREINRAPNGIRWLAKIQHDEPPARLGDTVHFGQTRLPVRQIPQPVANRDDIK